MHLFVYKKYEIIECVDKVNTFLNIIKYVCFLCFPGETKTLDISKSDRRVTLKQKKMFPIREIMIS